MDLKQLQYQRDKNLQIYESIRDSLPDIQFYETVTNLKLETSDGRLHVHVTEDLNETIPYPPKTRVSHILDDREHPPLQVTEGELNFESHLSGFVYKVKLGGREYIKKEIPGPDTVDEFLYEINALHDLAESTSVIQLEAVVVDDKREKVKGLLISYAEKGALVDLLFDHKERLPWRDRLQWAQQAAQGLSEIHEAGYVQGDLTLSNIVIDEENNAKIIDINRRGCPVGWEPPEISKKIASKQRSSMYLGENADLYQLGMTLWALAMNEDEPERHDPPLNTKDFPVGVPRLYQEIVEICLSPRPKDRLSAKELLTMFAELLQPVRGPSLRSEVVTSATREQHPTGLASAIEAEDLRYRRRSRRRQNGDNNGTVANSGNFRGPSPSHYRLDSVSPSRDVPRGRRGRPNAEHLSERPHSQHRLRQPGSGFFGEEPQIVPISPTSESDFDEIELDVHPYLVPESSFGQGEIRILERNDTERSDMTQADIASLEPVASFTDTNVDNICMARSTGGPQSQLVPGQASSKCVSTAQKGSGVFAASFAPLPPPPLELASADLVGCGAHPILGDTSPHEPKVVRGFQFSMDDDKESLAKVKSSESENPPSDVSAAGLDGVQPSIQRTDRPHEPSLKCTPFPTLEGHMKKQPEANSPAHKLLSSVISVRQGGDIVSTAPANGSTRNAETETEDFSADDNHETTTATTDLARGRLFCPIFQDAKRGQNDLALRPNDSTQESDEPMFQGSSEAAPHTLLNHQDTEQEAISTSLTKQNNEQSLHLAGHHPAMKAY